MRRVIFLPALLLILTACNHPFTADVATDPQIPGATRLTGKLYLSNSHLRIEWGLFTDVFDLNKRTGWRIITSTKTYWDLAHKDLSTYAPEMTNGSLCPHAQVPSACKLLGQEELEGRMANKWDLWDPKGFHVYFWTDKKLGITLLSEVGDATHRVTTYQVKNLRGGAVADTMFELPAGYTRSEGLWRP